jgi:alkylation response protein AidB-like acyl-CoA dehydrogenase
MSQPTGSRKTARPHPHGVGAHTRGADGEALAQALAASVAKSTMNVASRQVCGDAIQAMGGIGFTWEHPAHLHFRRAATSATLFGDPADHRGRLLRALAV